LAEEDLLHRAGPWPDDAARASAQRAVRRRARRLSSPPMHTGKSGQTSVVTGGCGFVGEHLMDALVARGDRVICVDLSDPGRDDVVAVKADITDPKAVREAIAGADTVFHNASVVQTRQHDTDLVWRVNLEG